MTSGSLILLVFLIRITLVIVVRPVIQVILVVSFDCWSGFSLPLFFHLNFSFLTQPFVDRMISVFNKIFFVHCTCNLVSALTK